MSTLDVENNEACCVCGHEAHSMCRCTIRMYCGRRCQEYDWRAQNHHLTCESEQANELDSKSYHGPTQAGTHEDLRNRIDSSGEHMAVVNNTHPKWSQGTYQYRRTASASQPTSAYSSQDGHLDSVTQDSNNTSYKAVGRRTTLPQVRFRPYMKSLSEEGPKRIQADGVTSKGPTDRLGTPKYIEERHDLAHRRDFQASSPPVGQHLYSKRSYSRTLSENHFDRGKKLSIALRNQHGMPMPEEARRDTSFHPGHRQNYSRDEFEHGRVTEYRSEPLKPSGGLDYQTHSEAWKQDEFYAKRESEAYQHIPPDYRQAPAASGSYTERKRYRAGSIDQLDSMVSSKLSLIDNRAIYEPTKQQGAIYSGESFDVNDPQTTMPDRKVTSKASSVAEAASESSFTCKWKGCGKVCRSIGGLVRHTHHHSNRPRIFYVDINTHPYRCQWSKCSEKFKHVSDLNQHAAMHATITDAQLRKAEGKIPLSYKCTFAGCGKLCRSVGGLKQHAVVHKTEPKPPGIDNTQQEAIAGSNSMGYQGQVTHTSQYSQPEGRRERVPQMQRTSSREQNSDGDPTNRINMVPVSQMGSDYHRRGSTSHEGSMIETRFATSNRATHLSYGKQESIPLSTASRQSDHPNTYHVSYNNAREYSESGSNNARQQYENDYENHEYYSIPQLYDNGAATEQYCPV